MITANLPSRDFEATEAFYALLGFETRFKGESWLILGRDHLIVEFFPHPELRPEESWFSACMRLENIDELREEWMALDLPGEGIPRITAPFTPGEAPRMFALIDPDGSLWRVIETPA